MGASFLIPPQLTSWQKRALAELVRRVPRDRETLWVLSSGTQGLHRVKAVGLKREAIASSASAVNAFLQATRHDRWLCAIPTYHIGGHAIGVRAALLGAKVFSLKRWSPQAFQQKVEEERISLSSLVPTQVFDLVQAGLAGPQSLRAVVVGGGFLDEDLGLRARALGWPVLPSYGLTETASQVATAPLDLKSTALELLSHARIELREQQICIQASSLCHWLATSDGESFTLEDPRRDGWLATEDLGRWVPGPAGTRGLRVLGRRDDVVKVLGVLVSLPQVQADLERFLPQCALLALKSAREGQRLLAVSDAPLSAAQVAAAVDRYNAQAAGPSRVALAAWVAQIPRTALGKVKKAELSAQLRLQARA